MVGSWDPLKQISTVTMTFVQVTFVLATFVHIMNISTLTQYCPNFKGMFQGPSDALCHGDICPGNICPGKICPGDIYSILTKLFGPNFWLER